MSSDIGDMGKYWKAAASEAWTETRRVWKVPDTVDLWKTVVFPAIVGIGVFVATRSIGATLLSVGLLLIVGSVTFLYQLAKVPPRWALAARNQHRSDLDEASRILAKTKGDHARDLHVFEDRSRTAQAEAAIWMRKHDEARRETEMVRTKVYGQEPDVVVQGDTVRGSAEGLKLDVAGGIATIEQISGHRLFEFKRPFLLGGYELVIDSYGQASAHPDDPMAQVFKKVICRIVRREEGPFSYARA